MSLSPGTRLGPYEIVGPLGAGGMGEVYRALDTKLDRQVALKFLPEHLQQDPERLARFEREAKVLASLNHPNIAQIYGLEDGALVMELVEGETAHGPVPLETALDYARQIISGLEAAHDKGIVHRDLKPANIMITPDGVVKLLDFGLAKAEEGPLSGDSANAPTLTMSPTYAGMILGTAGYMSPEQARGKSVDKRADIWAFGVVLYELLTGRRLFGGETVSDKLAAVLTKEPEWSLAPPPTRRLLQRCLEKDPKRRLRDIGDALDLLDGPPELELPRVSKLPWLVAGALALALAVALWFLWPRAAERPLVRLDIDLGPDAVLDDLTVAALSPDGARLVYPVRSASGLRQLATRLLNQPQAAILAGTDGAIDPFFSPDSKWIGFFTETKLKKIPAQGGAAIVLCDLGNAGRGASWSDDGTIVAVVDPASTLVRIPGDGGKPQPITRLQPGEETHRWPQVLPGGKAALFTAHSSTGDFDNANIEVVSLPSGARKTLVRGGYFGRYLPLDGSSGALLYIHQGTLYAVAFDSSRLELRGTPVAMIDTVAGEPGFAAGRFDFSGTGLLAYLSGRVAAQTWPISWLDRSGKLQPLLASPSEYYGMQFSPDGRLLAFNEQGEDLYVYDHRRAALSRLTYSGKLNVSPTWSPDGVHLVYASVGGQEGQIFWMRADGAGEPVLLQKFDVRGVGPRSISPDGRLLLFDKQAAQTGWDLYTLSLDTSDPEHAKAGRPELFLATPFDERYPVFSPDGRWVAYQSNESGRTEVYVRPFPAAGGAGGKWQVSTEGGQFPVWAPKGHTLFYESLDNRIMAADYTAAGSSFSLERPRQWSAVALRPIAGTVLSMNLAVAPDGQRFAVLPRSDPAGDAKSTHLAFLMNFNDEVRRRLARGR